MSPADTETWPSGEMRIASSASTRLRLSARSRPINSAVPESLTSAFGAVATIARSRSRTTMSRMRTAMRMRPARSIWVPPISTVLPWPIFSSIAGASQGVAMSRLIGPAPSRHHSPPKQTTKITISAAVAIATRLTQRSPASQRRSEANLIADAMNARARPVNSRRARWPAASSWSCSQSSSSHCDGWASARGPTELCPRLLADAVPGGGLGATNSLPLPLGAGADCGLVRRQRRARRSPSSAPVPASLPILDYYC